MFSLNSVLNTFLLLTVSDLMDLFRGVMAVDERSERALQLTEEVIDENPANYTAWYYRRKILESIGADLGKELNFMDTVDSFCLHPSP